jgi:hypothetical protein
MDLLLIFLYLFINLTRLTLGKYWRHEGTESRVGKGTVRQSQSVHNRSSTPAMSDWVHWELSIRPVGCSLSLYYYPATYLAQYFTMLQTFPHDVLPSPDAIPVPDIASNGNKLTQIRPMISSMVFLLLPLITLHAYYISLQTYV